jgi:competence protein ComEA
MGIFAMEPATAIRTGVPPSAPPSSLLTWPSAVQLALGFLVIASVFFLLGRWSQTGPSLQPEAHAREPAPPDGIDLNLATKAELRLIPGIGDALAQRIVDYRGRNGPFRAVDELRKVSGIGPKTLERVRHHLFVAAPESFVATDDDEAAPADMMPRSARGSSASKKAGELKGLIDVNQATQAELQKLPGIGPKLSQRILDERAKSAFKSVDDLRRVPGIGAKTLEKLRPHVTASRDS